MPLKKIKKSPFAFSPCSQARALHCPPHLLSSHSPLPYLPLPLSPGQRELLSHSRWAVQRLSSAWDSGSSGSIRQAGFSFSAWSSQLFPTNLRAGVRKRNLPAHYCCCPTLAGVALEFPSPLGQQQVGEEEGRGEEGCASEQGREESGILKCFGDFKKSLTAAPVAWSAHSGGRGMRLAVMGAATLAPLVAAPTPCFAKSWIHF